MSDVYETLISDESDNQMPLEVTTKDPDQVDNITPEDIRGSVNQGMMEEAKFHSVNSQQFLKATCSHVRCAIACSRTPGCKGYSMGEIGECECVLATHDVGKGMDDKSTVWELY